MPTMLSSLIIGVKTEKKWRMGGYHPSPITVYLLPTQIITIQDPSKYVPIPMAELCIEPYTILLRCLYNVSTSRMWRMPIKYVVRQCKIV
jgi:hypothetical protein